MSVNSKPYRGAIEIYDDGNGLMIVNELGVEAYLAGIVSNGVGRLAEDALRAQAA